MDKKQETSKHLKTMLIGMISLLGLTRIKSLFFIINVVKTLEKQHFSAFFWERILKIEKNLKIK